MLAQHRHSGYSSEAELREGARMSALRDMGDTQLPSGAGAIMSRRG